MMLPSLTPQRIKLLDSDVLIDLQRGYPPALAWYLSVPPGMLALPGHALMELYQAAQNTAQTLAVDQLTEHFPLIWPTDLECLEAVRNFRLLHLSQGVGLIDADCRHRPEPECPDLHLQPQTLSPHPRPCD